MTTDLTNIPVFNVQTEWDLRGVPSLKLTNLSTGPQTDVKFIYSLYYPNGFPVHAGSFTTADATGPWTTLTLPEELPEDVFGLYRIVFSIQDGTETRSFERYIDVVRPAGNKFGGNNNFGKGEIYYEVRCSAGKIFADDRSNNSYKGLQGDIIERIFTLTAPPDETGVRPDPVTATNYPSALFPLTYNGEGFYISLNASYSYHVADDVFLIRYYTSVSFPVVCNIDLCKIACKVREFEYSVLCSSDKDKLRVLTLINSKLNTAIIGQLQPGCGINVSDVVQEIIDLGPFDCACLTDFTSGIGTSASSVPTTPAGAIEFTYATADVNNQTVFVLTDTDGNSLVGATIIQVISEIKPLKKNEYLWNPNTSTISLIGNSTTVDQTLFILYTKPVL